MRGSEAVLAGSGGWGWVRERVGGEKGGGWWRGGCGRGMVGVGVGKSWVGQECGEGQVWVRGGGEGGGGVSIVSVGCVKE